MVITLILVQASHSSETKPTHFYASEGNCFCRTRFEVSVNNKETAGKAKPMNQEGLNSSPRKAAIAARAKMQALARKSKKVDNLLKEE